MFESDASLVVHRLLGDSHANSYTVFIWCHAVILTLIAINIVAANVNLSEVYLLGTSNFRTLKRIRCLCWEGCSGTLANCNWRQSCGIKLAEVVWITDQKLTKLALKEHSIKCAQALF